MYVCIYIYIYMIQRKTEAREIDGYEVITVTYRQNGVLKTQVWMHDIWLQIAGTNEPKVCSKS